MQRKPITTAALANSCSYSLSGVTLFFLLAGPAIAANPDHVQRLLKTNQCPMCDLSGANLADANLFGANLVNANLQGANLSGANLGSANLTDADLTGAKLTKAYLYQATLENTNLSQADLSGAYLKSVVLTNSNLSRANLQGINLSRVNLSGISLKGTDLSGANLSNATLSGIRQTMKGSDLDAGHRIELFISQYLCTESVDESSMEAAKAAGFDLAFADLQGAKLRGANLSGAILVNGNLTGADFTNANLTGACLNRSVLKNAILDGADLKDAKLSQAILDGASLKGTKNAALAEAFSTEADAKRIPAEKNAKQSVGSMIRAQQAYYLEQSKFAAKLGDLGVGIEPDTDTYLYRVFVYSNPTKGVMLASVPRSSGFKTYVGFVNMTKLNTGEVTTLTTFCESEEAKPLLPQLPPLPKSGPIQCPSGFKPVNEGI